MKELESIQKDTVEIVDETPIKKQLNFLGSARKRPGHTLWEYDPKTREITKAVLETKAHGSFKVGAPNVTYRHKVVTKEGCYYVQALNKKNAIKKFMKLFLNGNG